MIQLMESWRDPIREKRLSEALEMSKQGYHHEALSEIDGVLFSLRDQIKILEREEKRFKSHKESISRKTIGNK
jgi:hypothetical protein